MSGKNKKRGKSNLNQPDIMELVLDPQEAADYREEAALKLIEEENYQGAWEKLAKNLEESLRPRPLSFALAAAVMCVLEEEEKAQKYLETAMYDLLLFARQQKELLKDEKSELVFIKMLAAISTITSILEERGDHQEIYDLTCRLLKVLPGFFPAEYMKSVAAFNQGEYEAAISLWKEWGREDKIFKDVAEVADMVVKKLVPPFTLDYMPVLIDYEYYDEMISFYLNNPLNSDLLLQNGSLKMYLLITLFSKDSPNELKQRIIRKLEKSRDEWAWQLLQNIAKNSELGKKIGSIPEKENTKKRKKRQPKKDEYKVFWSMPSLTPQLMQLIIAVMEENPGLFQEREFAIILPKIDKLVFLEDDGASFIMLEEEAYKILVALVEAMRKKKIKIPALENLYREFYDYVPREDNEDGFRVCARDEKEVIPFFCYEEEKRKNIEDKILPANFTILKSYKNMPAEWSRISCQLHRLPVYPKREEREKALQEYLLSEAGLQSALDFLSPSEKELLKLLLKRGGTAYAGMLKEKHGFTTEGDGYYELASPPASPLGKLWLKGLVFIGRRNEKGIPVKIVEIPQELKDRIKI